MTIVIYSTLLQFIYILLQKMCDQVMAYEIKEFKT